MGDLVDRRKYVNYVTARCLRECFVDQCVERGVKLHMLVGNHDTPYRASNDVCAQRELGLHNVYGVDVHSDPVLAMVGTTQTLFLPWICDANRERSMELIGSSPTAVAMGHLELAGFETQRGRVADHGMSASLFEKYEIVLSGHYHQPSVSVPVHYVGAPYEMTWADYDCPRGFRVLDTDTLALHAVSNPLKIHAKLHYDEGCETRDADVAGKIVKLVVKSRQDPVRYDGFVQTLQDAGVSQLQVVEDHRHADAVPDAEIATSVSDTLTMLEACARESSDECDVAALSVLLADLYARAQEVEA